MVKGSRNISTAKLQKYREKLLIYLEYRFMRKSVKSIWLQHGHLYTDLLMSMHFSLYH